MSNQAQEEQRLREKTAREFEDFQQTGAYQWLIDNVSQEERDGFNELLKAQTKKATKAAKIKVLAAQMVLEWVENSGFIVTDIHARNDINDQRDELTNDH